MYCEMSCCSLSCTEAAILDEALDEWVLAKGITYKEVFFFLVCEEVSSMVLPQAVRDV